MPDFKGSEKIELQPADADHTYEFKITVNSSASANDGNIPYGTNVDSAVVTATNEAGVDASDALIESSSVLLNVIRVIMSYPTALGQDRYHLKFVCTLDNAEVHELKFNRVQALIKD